MKRNTLRWPFPESLRHRPDEAQAIAGRIEGEP